MSRSLRLGLLILLLVISTGCASFMDNAGAILRSSAAGEPWHTVWAFVLAGSCTASGLCDVTIGAVTEDGQDVLVDEMRVTMPRGETLGMDFARPGATMARIDRSAWTGYQDGHIQRVREVVDVAEIRDQYRSAAYEVQEAARQAALNPPAPPQARGLLSVSPPTHRFLPADGLRVKKDD